MGIVLSQGLTRYVEGQDRIFDALAELPKKIKNKHLRKAVSDGTKLVLWSAKAKAPRKSGLLYKSMGRKTVAHKNLGGILLGMVGARKGFRTQVGTWAAGKQAGKPKFADPTKYLHLVELGTVRSRAAGMLRDALKANSQAIVGKLAGAVADALAAAGKGGAA